MCKELSGELSCPKALLGELSCTATGLIVISLTYFVCWEFIVYATPSVHSFVCPFIDSMSKFFLLNPCFH